MVAQDILAGRKHRVLLAGKVYVLGMRLLHVLLAKRVGLPQLIQAMRVIAVFTLTIASKKAHTNLGLREIRTRHQLLIVVSVAALVLISTEPSEKVLAKPGFHKLLSHSLRWCRRIWRVQVRIILWTRISNLIGRVLHG